MSATVYRVETEQEREEAVEAVATAVAGGRTVVIPTDTVYGIAADAFSRGGVQQLLAAKGRSRQMPPPVLIRDAGVLPGLADGPSEQAQALAEAFWPGALTIIVHAQPSLSWDLGETAGTVALRVPDDDLARQLLHRTGPLAVSSANRTGRTAATTAEEALEQLGERVEVILDGGIRPVGRDAETPSDQVRPSTIVDCTGDRPVVLRSGAISLAELREVVPETVTRRQLHDERRAAERAEGRAEARRARDEGDAQDGDEFESEGRDGEAAPSGAGLTGAGAGATAAGATGAGAAGAGAVGGRASRAASSEESERAAREDREQEALSRLVSAEPSPTAHRAVDQLRTPITREEAAERRSAAQEAAERNVPGASGPRIRPLGVDQARSLVNPPRQES